MVLVLVLVMVEKLHRELQWDRERVKTKLKRAQCQKQMEFPEHLVITVWLDVIVFFYLKENNNIKSWKIRLTLTVAPGKKSQLPVSTGSRLSSSTTFL